VNSDRALQSKMPPKSNKGSDSSSEEESTTTTVGGATSTDALLAALIKQMKSDRKSAKRREEALARSIAAAVAAAIPGSARPTGTRPRTPATGGGATSGGSGDPASPGNPDGGNDGGQDTGRPIQAIRFRADFERLKGGGMNPSWAHYRAWKADLDNTLATQVDTWDLFPEDRKIATIVRAFSVDFQRTWRVAIEPGLPRPGSDHRTAVRVFRDIEEYVKRTRNIMLDRQAFLTRAQKPGETVQDFVCILTDLALQAEMFNHCLETQMLM
jgi:hypothetical protein